jgi:ring-1,2-phenylacetyl-CoA epoxidase subunit PaaE
MRADSTLSVLEAAEQACFDLPSQCRAGLCATCRARTLAGRVEMAVNMVLEAEEIDAGFVLMCQSRPATEVLELEVVDP